jgi:hypothetical protein
VAAPTTLTDRYSERNERARKAIDRQIEKL